MFLHISSSSDIESSIASANAEISDKTSSISSSSFLLPGFVVSVFLNIVSGGVFLSDYFSSSPSKREDEQPYQFVPPSYQELPTPEAYPEPTPIEDKMDRLEGLRVEYLNGIEHDQHSKQDRYDDMYMEDIYYSLPRSLSYS